MPFRTPLQKIANLPARRVPSAVRTPHYENSPLLPQPASSRCLLIAYAEMLPCRRQIHAGRPLSSPPLPSPPPRWLIRLSRRHRAKPLPLTANPLPARAYRRPQKGEIKIPGKPHFKSQAAGHDQPHQLPPSAAYPEGGTSGKKLLPPEFLCPVLHCLLPLCATRHFSRFPASSPHSSAADRIFSNLYLPERSRYSIFYLLLLPAVSNKRR